MIFRLATALALLGVAIVAQAEEPAPSSKRTAFFNERWLDTVISIERDDGPIGTGFIVQLATKELAVATAAHVIRPQGKTLDRLLYRRSDLPEDGALISDDELRRADVATWVFHPGQDLAVRGFGWKPEHGAPPFIPSTHFLPRAEHNVGASLLVLGFPTGLRSTTHVDPIARRGSIARFGEEGLLIEAFVFPGNSGGPVIYVPSVKVGGPINSPLVNEEMLVGIVSSYIPYQEPAISAKTGRPRVVFEENSGLANVVPVHALAELLSKLEKP